MMGCIARLFGLAVLGLLLFLAWTYRGPLVNAVRGWQGRETAAEVVSPELADAAEDKLALLAAGEAGGQVALSEAEVQSLVQYRFGGFLPDFVDSPRVELEDDHLRFRLRVPTAEFPRLRGAGELISLLPDTAEIVGNGQLIPVREGGVALALNDLSAGGIPVPRRFIPPLLQRLGRIDEPGLPAEAIGIPLPPGASAAYVRRDSLVFVAPARQRRGDR